MGPIGVADGDAVAVEDVAGLLVDGELVGDDEGVDEEGEAVENANPVVELPLTVSKNSTVVVEKAIVVFWPTYVVYAPCATPPGDAAHMYPVKSTLGAASVKAFWNLNELQ